MINKKKKDFDTDIPVEIRKMVLHALSFYPELRDIRVEFVINENIRKSVMQAQPKFITMFGSRKKRTYLIKISKSFNFKGKSIPIHELPEDVFIGWIGHELGHIMDYLKRSNWSLILFGIGYLTSKSFIISAERIADTYAVNHGLGKYILATKDFILHQAGMSEQYIKKIKRLYLPPEEIIFLMENIVTPDTILKDEG
jgi:hypothetical protein